MSVWSVLLPYLWRRQESKYALEWGTLSMRYVFEPCRPEHYGEARFNVVTGQIEPYFPMERRVKYYIFSVVVLLGVCSGVCIGVLALMLLGHWYRGSVVGGALTFC